MSGIPPDLFAQKLAEIEAEIGWTMKVIGTNHKDWYEILTGLINLKIEHAALICEQRIPAALAWNLTEEIRSLKVPINQ